METKARVWDWKVVLEVRECLVLDPWATWDSIEVGRQAFIVDLVASDVSIGSQASIANKKRKMIYLNVYYCYNICETSIDFHIVIVDISK